MATPPEHPEQSTAAALKAVRLRLGLTKRELASVLGIARTTVREVEAGRAPRHSTLVRYLAEVPWLAPSALLPGPARVPPALGRVSAFHRRAQGMRVGRLSVVVTAEGAGTGHELSFILSRVRTVGIRLDVDAVRTALMRTVFVGSPALLGRVQARASDLDGEPLSFEDDLLRHEYLFAADLLRGGFSYTCTGRFDATADARRPTGVRVAAQDGDVEIGVDVQHPVDELELRVGCSEGQSHELAQMGARPAAVGIEDPEAFLGSLHGDALEVTRRSGTLAARLARPPLGTSYDARFVVRAEGVATPALAERRQPRDDDTLASVLGEARARAGLSIHALAARMGVAPMTVLRAERAQDVRQPVLESALDSLPELSPWHLFADACEGTELSFERLAAYYRDLYGCEAGEETKEVKLAPDGTSSIRIATRELRRLRPSPHDLSLHLGQSKSLLQKSRAALRSVDASREELQQLRIRREGGRGRPTSYVLSVPARLADAGVSFSRKFEQSGLYAMTAERGREATGRQGPFHEGVSFAALLPARRLALAVVFPRGAWPHEPRAHAWPLTAAPDPEGVGIAEAAHPDGLRVEADRRRGRLTLRVEQPVRGVKYSLSWRLP